MHGTNEKIKKRILSKKKCNKGNTNSHTGGTSRYILYTTLAPTGYKLNTK